jgi:Domain of unknown function (DUF4062)
MAESITEYKVFIASPGDLGTERDAVVELVDEINATHGVPLGYRLRVIRYETNAASGAGQPQAVVNDFIGNDYDFFIGLMWKRFGSPTTQFGSGTEEEYRRAYERWSKAPFPLMFYFLQKPFMPRESPELDQLQEVLSFRKELAQRQFAWSCDDLGQFRDLVRKHICLWMNKQVRPSQGRTDPTASAIGALSGLWDRMDPGLRTAFAVAYNENRMVGDGGVQTQDLFAALLRTQADQLAPLISEFPPGALPPPTGGPIVTTQYISSERPWLSHCVEDSIRRLSGALPEGRQLTALDIFTDIARYGTGRSVQLLREHNVGPDDIKAIVEKKGLSVVNRE